MTSTDCVHPKDIYPLYNTLMTRSKNIYLQKLSSHLGFSESKRLVKLLDELMTEDEAHLLASLPQTFDELLSQFNFQKEDLDQKLNDLFSRGLLLLSEQEDGSSLYVFDHKPGRFMDSIMFDPRYRQSKDEAFFDSWKAFYNEEMIPTHKERPDIELPFRVITVSKEIESHQEILPYEHVEKLVEKAENIAVQDCPCRVRERNCDNPLQTCLSLNRLADYIVARGIGRRIEKSEAIEIIRKSEELGLIHEVDNNVDPTVICNCCTCCCTFLRAVTVYGQNSVVAGSRYRALIGPETCIACGLCVEKCQFNAIREDELVYSIDQDKCIGCGLCVSHCPQDAIKMVLVKKDDFIPADRTTFFEGVDAVPGKAGKQGRHQSK